MLAKKIRRRCVCVHRGSFKNKRTDSLLCNVLNKLQSHRSWVASRRLYSNSTFKRGRSSLGRHTKGILSSCPICEAAAFGTISLRHLFVDVMFVGIKRQISTLGNHPHKEEEPTFVHFYFSRNASQDDGEKSIVKRFFKGPLFSFS